MDTIEKFKSFLTCLGLAMVPDDFFEKREEWISSLSENDVIALLQWVENSKYDQFLIGLERFQSRVLQEAFIVSATVGKRLNSDLIRERIESLFPNPRLKEFVIEGIDIYGSDKSLPFLSSVISSENDEQILVEVATALNNIGGSEALKLLLDIKKKAKFSKVSYSELLDELIEEVKCDNSGE